MATSDACPPGGKDPRRFRIIIVARIQCPILILSRMAAISALWSRKFSVVTLESATAAFPNGSG